MLLANDMNTKKLDDYFKQLLNVEEFSNIDVSKNGLQVDNDGSKLSKIAFAVDASLETIKRASFLQASLLFVHHGLFWKDVELIKGSHYKRIKALLDAKILYECHRFDMKSKKSLNGEKKYYLSDTSFYFTQNTDNRINFGPVLENVIYICP